MNEAGCAPFPTMQTVVVRLRLRDRHARELSRQARAVNFVFNYCNEVQQKAARSNRKWLSAFDLMRLTAGSGKELGLHAHTIQRVCRAYDRSRRAKGKPWLRWRSRRSLGWVPFNTGCVSFDGEAFIFRGSSYRTMHLRGLIQKGAVFGGGSFNADARGRWYINVPVNVACAPSRDRSSVGVDLGLKSLATLSSGEVIEAPRFYRENEGALAKAQRARKSKRARAIHAKARNRRQDFLHKAANAIVQAHGLIVVGDVSPSRLAKTSMAKSVNDAGWAGFKSMLSYKALRHGGRVLEVSEAYSTQTCSDCGSIGGPRGLKGLAIREWSCSECGAVHDRDVNGARNILRAGLGSLVEGALHVG